MLDIRQTNRSLWLIAQDFLTLLANLFGAPEAIAEKHALLHRDWARCCRWLRAGEALMRLLLLIEAGAMAKPNVQSRTRAKAKRARRLVGFAPENPEAWRVSFRVLSPQTKKQAAAPRAARKPLDHLRSAWPLAERAEALLRVFNDPAPFARRLASRLYAATKRAFALLAFPDEAPALVGEDEFEQARHGAALALRTFNTS